jgi:NTP pyrophosphatase (non-canonical NTP hydrolase)
MWDQVGQLHAYHGNVPVEVRLLKLTEEVGEAAEAFLGVHGLNKRKGICRSREDLLAELADVIITAAVAMSGITGDVDEARRHLERRLTAVTERAGL